MARLDQRPEEFKFYAPGAKKVILSGSFNNWDTKKLSAKKDSKGHWAVKVNLPKGRHEYKFIVDGSWVNDTNCSYCVPNSFGSQNCVREIK